MKAICTHIFV
uniref:Uncharacterized protein n=1 Tax=Lepeophtheirus salmonis TaxID=72036 RepID=A0A0K2TT19_LEPSM